MLLLLHHCRGIHTELHTFKVFLIEFKKKVNKTITGLFPALFYVARRVVFHVAA